MLWWVKLSRVLRLITRLLDVLLLLFRWIWFFLFIALSFFSLLFLFVNLFLNDFRYARFYINFFATIFSLFLLSAICELAKNIIVTYLNLLLVISFLESFHIFVLFDRLFIYKYLFFYHFRPEYRFWFYLIFLDFHRFWIIIFAIFAVDWFFSMLIDWLLLLLRRILWEFVWKYFGEILKNMSDGIMHIAYLLNYIFRSFSGNIFMYSDIHAIIDHDVWVDVRIVVHRASLLRLIHWLLIMEIIRLNL